MSVRVSCAPLALPPSSLTLPRVTSRCECWVRTHVQPCVPLTLHSFPHTSVRGRRPLRVRAPFLPHALVCSAWLCPPAGGHSCTSVPPFLSRTPVRCPAFHCVICILLHSPSSLPPSGILPWHSRVPRGFLSGCWHTSRASLLVVVATPACVSCPPRLGTLPFATSRESQAAPLSRAHLSCCGYGLWAATLRLLWLVYSLCLKDLCHPSASLFFPLSFLLLPLGPMPR